MYLSILHLRIWAKHLAHKYVPQEREEGEKHWFHLMHVAVIWENPQGLCSENYWANVSENVHFKSETASIKRNWFPVSILLAFHFSDV